MSTYPVEKIYVSKLISRVTHDALGRPVNHQRNYSANSNVSPFKADGVLKSHYYSEELNKIPGVSYLIAWLETLTGFLLWRSAPSPATAINEFTTLSELGQVHVGRMSKLSEERSDGAMAWLQVIAGVGGLTSCFSDLIFDKEKESKELSINEKTSLTIASIFNSVAMFFGAGEKTLIATTTSQNGEKSKSKSIRMNGNSDARCCVEWFAMSLVPWFSKFEPFKKVLDYLITYFALREGIEHFVKNGVSMVFNDKVKQLPLWLKKIFSAVFLVGKDESKTIIWPFNKKWFLGTENDKNINGETTPGLNGTRGKIMKVLRGFGCNPPICYFDKAGNIVSEFYGDLRNIDSFRKTRKSIDNYYKDSSSSILSAGSSLISTGAVVS